MQDASGAAVSGALVVAVDNQAAAAALPGVPGPSQRTGRAGVFQLSLRPGFYDLCAFSAGFSASCQKIYIPANNATLRRKIKLSLDPVVEKERGDVFQ